MFAELQAQDEAFLAKLREVEKCVQALRSLHIDLTTNAAETIRLAIMQRKNAEDALAAIKSANAPGQRAAEPSAAPQSWTPLEP
jgi:predicted metalloenzyme YecM